MSDPKSSEVATEPQIFTTELGQIVVGARWYDVNRTLCAGCKRTILIAHRKTAQRTVSALYDRITLDPLHGAHGDRHVCPSKK